MAGLAISTADALLEHQSAAPYDIEAHRHRAAAWAAARAASVKGCRFKVYEGRKILEAIGLDAKLALPTELPSPQQVDDIHRKWRQDARTAAEKFELKLSDGVAAKLINCYLKARFVCGGYHAHPNVSALHPPIDDLLLKELADRGYGGSAAIWRRARNTRWSKLDSVGYETVIAEIRRALGNAPLWQIEEHWRGFQ
jgi:hypothetical protein